MPLKWAHILRHACNALNAELTIRELITSASRTLAPVSESPRLDAELLLTQALDVARTYLAAHPEDLPDAAAQERFARLVERRRDQVPIAYLTGEKEFWSLSLLVTPDTLIPRPDTETLVEQALLRLPRDGACDVLDLGTGSGAVALAIARERPDAKVIATDVSAAALTVATENARRLLLPNVEFRHGDWLEPVNEERFDMIVSNPPYVASSAPELAALRHEPRMALLAGDDGLDALTVIATGQRQGRPTGLPPVTGTWCPAGRCASRLARPERLDRHRMYP